MKQLDAIAIIEDKSPPLILSTHPGNNGKYPSLELNQFKIMIDDKLSGFDPNESSFDLLLDNVPLIYTYQPKLKIISFDLRCIKDSINMKRFDIKSINKHNLYRIIWDSCTYICCYCVLLPSSGNIDFCYILQH